MIPAEFTSYFTAAAAAAGVLIGLLFVAVSLRPETVFGDRAMPAAKAQAGSAFTSLVISFFVVLPGHRLVRGRAQPGLVAGPGPAPGRASCGWEVTCRQ